VVGLYYKVTIGYKPYENPGVVDEAVDAPEAAVRGAGGHLDRRPVRDVDAGGEGRGAQCAALGGGRLGFGRIVASGIAAPNMLAIPV
jgi:hypothetical protein